MSNIQSPKDENGYLIPITIIDLDTTSISCLLNNTNTKTNDINKQTIQNNVNNTKNLQLRRQSSMKVESKTNTKKKVNLFVFIYFF